MLKNWICFLLLALVIGDVPFAKAQEQDGEWHLVFSDEFNGRNGSQPDSTKWVRCIRYNAGWNRWISNSKDVVFVKNGKLVCRAIPNRTEPHDTACMLTGAIETRGKFSFQYGKVEVRMKTNLKRGNFPAAWMKPEVIDPNRYGEIDIVEMFGNQGLAQQTIHNHITTILKQGRPFNANKRIRLDKWHVYGIEWMPENILFLIDGEVTKVFQKSTDKKELENGQWTFDRPFYLLLNQSVGDGNYDCMIPYINQVYETLFDWVRVYQRNPSVNRLQKNHQRK
ncbi:MAG: glycoside hydrolase family 16 protein [Prevotella sp.]|nr:glycoside hydrolase family 16 protein [Prevotella sp.]